MDLQAIVKQMIEKKISAGEAFTSACISHPLIHDDPMIRHREVNDIIKQMWNSSDFDSYCRTNISVWSDGVEQKAFLYHPLGYDTSTFQDHSRNLNRFGVTHVPVQQITTKNSSKSTTMSIPKHLIKNLGWQPGDKLSIINYSSEVQIFRDNGLVKPKKRVSKDGRIRLFGSIVKKLGSNPDITTNGSVIILKS